MKITVYTITDCQFSKQEKEYLKAHNLAYEEKNLETNHEFLTEMLKISDNFAGTPVTVVEKDTDASVEKTDDKKDTKDAKKLVLKGFTAEEFDTALGFEKKEGEEKKDDKPKEAGTEEKKPSMESPKTQPSVVVVNQPTTVNAQSPTPVTPPSTQPQQSTQTAGTPTPTMDQQTQPTTPTPQQQQITNTEPQQLSQQQAPSSLPPQPTINVDPSMPAVQQPAEEAINDASLDAILKDLQEKAGAADGSQVQTAQAMPTIAQAPAQNTPVQQPSAPVIPDFGNS